MKYSLLELALVTHRHVLLASSASLILLGCGNGTDPGSGVAAAVQIDTRLLTVAPGGALQLHATVRDASGQPIPGATVRWSSSNPATLRVSPDGTAQGITRGSARIVAAVGATADTVPGVVGTYASLTAGFNSTCARTTAGELACWGEEFGVAVPTLVPNGQSMRSLSLGGYYYCSLDAAGYPSCHSNPLTNNPVAFTGSERFDTLVSGIYHACGVTSLGVAVCRGEMVADVTVGAEPLVTLASGGEHTQCALGASGSAYCWGEGREGQLGDGVRHLPGDEFVAPAPVLGQLQFTAITAGQQHVCGLTPAGGVYCWGYGVGGQLGNGVSASSAVPVQVAGTRTYRQLVAGGNHTCALGEDGVLDCWGMGAFGELGDGGAQNSDLLRFTPSPVAGQHRWLQVAAGFLHTCGLADDGNAYCWGFGGNGELGNGESGWDASGNAFMTSTPVLVPDP